MSALEKISYFQQRRDEVPNQDLARELARDKDQAGIAEIAANALGARLHASIDGRVDSIDATAITLVA